MPGDKVNRLGISYVALQVSATVWNVNSAPEWTPNYWGLLPCGTQAPAPTRTTAPAPAPAPASTACAGEAWVGSQRYMPGDRVQRYGVSYVANALSATVWNVNSPPESTRIYWDLVQC